jgi:HNH endonuclease
MPAPMHAPQLRPLHPNRRPMILTLDMFGQPHRWVTWQHALFYYAKNLVAWDAGEQCFTFVGGYSRMTGRRSEMTANSIIAIKGRALPPRSLHQTPPLSNRELFHRDRQICGYCGTTFTTIRLTRDHIKPVSQGGADTWMNVVTACRSCNQRKAGRTPEQAHMMLLYAPYVPNKAEYLILSNRNILADQMDFLSRHLPAQSRWRGATHSDHAIA